MKALKRTLAGLVGIAIPYGIYWVSGADFVRSGEMAIATMFALIFAGFFAACPIWDNKR